MPDQPLPEKPVPTAIPPANAPDRSPSDEQSQPVCPLCGGPVVEMRAKLQCSRCHTILETCCEGGRQ